MSIQCLFVLHPIWSLLYLYFALGWKQTAALIFLGRLHPLPLESVQASLRGLTAAQQRNEETLRLDRRHQPTNRRPSLMTPLQLPPPRQQLRARLASVTQKAIVVQSSKLSMSGQHVAAQRSSRQPTFPENVLSVEGMVKEALGKSRARANQKAGNKLWRAGPVVFQTHARANER
jgi:hypothetical protein